MNANLRSASILLAATLVPAALASPDAGPPPRIVVGPNILVSRDGDVAHCETMIAANPTDPKNLIGGSITMTRPDGGAANKAYVSVDGGSTWTDVAFPEEIEHGGGDPQVGFGANGTAFFMGLSNGMNFYRSEDGGKTWSKALNLGRHDDHEMLITDHTTGPFAGRVYVADETDQKGSNELEDIDHEAARRPLPSAGRRALLHRARGRRARGGQGPRRLQPARAVRRDALRPDVEYPNYAIEKEASTGAPSSRSRRTAASRSRPASRSPRSTSAALKKLREQQKSGRIDQIGGPVFAADLGREVSRPHLRRVDRSSTATGSS